MILLQAVADGRLSGGTTHVLQLVEAVREALAVELHLVGQRGSPALAEAAARGAVVHGIDFFGPRFDPRTWLALRRLVGRLRPAVIHGHGARASLPLTFVKGATPLIHSVHGYHFVGKPAGIRQLAIRAERRCSGQAALTLFVSRHDHDLAERAGILAVCREARVIVNGIDLAGLPPARGSEGGRTVGFLGRLSAEKNPAAVLDVLERLQDHRAVVIGDGPLLPALRARAAESGLLDRIALLGSRPRPEALDRLAGVDVLLVPSLWEGLPIAPLEAMAIGVPVVASAVGGLPEIIADGRTGLLVRSGDPDGLAGAVRRLTGQPDLRAAIVTAARALVERRFDWARTRLSYLDLYRTLLGL